VLPSDADWPADYDAGDPRVIPDRHFSVQLSHFMPGFRSYSVPVFLKRQSDITLGDRRYASISWGPLLSHSGALAIGPHLTDPRTGETLDADIVIVRTPPPHTPRARRGNWAAASRDSVAGCRPAPPPPPPPRPPRASDGPRCAGLRLAQHLPEPRRPAQTRESTSFHPPQSSFIWRVPIGTTSESDEWQKTLVRTQA
jgi:hypothetical protein